MSGATQKGCEQSGIAARILVAGGNLLAGALANALEAHGFSTRQVAPRVPEIERGIEWHPNLVILDVRSLDLTAGSALIGQLHRLGHHVCVIDEDRRRCSVERLDRRWNLGPHRPWRATPATPSHNRSAPPERSPPTDGTKSSPSLALTRAAGRPQDTRLPHFADLTERESVVLAELMEGHRAEEIARAAFVSISTVRSQIKAILQKLGVSSQLAAVALARRADWSLGNPAGNSPKPSSRQRTDVV